MSTSSSSEEEYFNTSLIEKVEEVDWSVKGVDINGQVVNLPYVGREQHRGDYLRNWRHSKGISTKVHKHFNRYTEDERSTIISFYKKGNSMNNTAKEFGLTVYMAKKICGSDH
jgi:hypothetical protein